MDSGNRWDVAGYQGLGEDKKIIDRIMLRFLPIAPKPTTGGSFSGDALLEVRNSVTSAKRVKRKYVKVRKNNNPKSRTRSCEDKPKDSLNSTIITLQLLPEKSEGKDSRAYRSWCNFPLAAEKISFEDNRDPQKCIYTDISFMRKNQTGVGSDRMSVVDRRSSMVVESRVTVEYVTSTCCMETVVVPSLLGCMDVEKKNNLEGDTCPGFISDGFGNVGWVNSAYKSMLVCENGNEFNGVSLKELPEVILWLNTKSKLPDTTAFLCLVRIEKLKNKNVKWSKMVPCDVWRMDFGGLAWSLDVKAALGLAL